MSNITGKVVVITGASSGIGESGRTDHIPPCGDREKGTWVIETQCPGTQHFGHTAERDGGKLLRGAKKTE